MDSLTEIHIFGERSLLAILKKQLTIPNSTYAKETKIEHIEITPDVSTDISLHISGVVLNDNCCTLKTSASQLLVTQFTTLGKTNFLSFLNEAESHGWQVVKYIDNINICFHVYQIHSLSRAERLFKFLFLLLLLLMLAFLPALSTLLTKNQEP